MNNKMKAMVAGFGIWLAMSGAVNAAEAMKGDGKAAPSQEAKMAEMMKMAAPGEGQKVLDAFVGSWTHTMKMWMAPDSKPEQATGTTVSQWVMGGRLVRQDARGTMSGQPFEGLGLTGYDNMKKEYNGIWIDNMTTGIMQSSMQYDAATKTFAENGTFACPMTGEKDKWYRSVTKITDKDHYSMEMYFKDDKGKEFKSMEILYTRAGETKK